MAADDWIQRSTRPRTTVAGAVGLFGLFAGLCAIFALVATVADWREEAAQARWPVVSARIEGGEVDPQRVSHGGTTWQLRYKVRFVVEGQERIATLTTRSERSDDEPAALHAWAVRHRRGSHVDIRYDPAQPGHAVFASADVPGAGPRTTPDLQLLLIAATACVGLLALAKHLRSKEAGAAPSPDAGNLSPGGRIGIGLAVAAMGFLMIGLNVHSALRATHPLTSEDFIGALAAMIFVFGGALLALPPDRAGLQRLLGALLVTTFALTLDWVAFGPGTRQFGGGISFGIGIGFRPSEFLGRAVFGIGALCFDIAAAVMWVRLIRQLRGSSTANS
jgi:hypothetical protein